MKSSLSTTLLIIAFGAILLGWCVDHFAFRQSVETPETFLEMGIQLGMALESTMIFPMHDNDGNPIDPERWSQVRKRELISNVLRMAEVHRIKETNAAVSFDSKSDGWNPSPVILASRSLELLNVNDVQGFQAVFEKQCKPLNAPDFFTPYITETGALKPDFVAFIKSALIWNAERENQSTE